MAPKILSYILTTVFVAISLTGCIEPFPIENQVYENVLVVETTITNELKHHKVRLTRVIRLSDSIDIYEKNAQVWIETDDQNTYPFSENDQGVYISDEEFQTVPDVAYKLFINTSDGKKYESREEYLTPDAEIAELYVEKEIQNAKQGAQIYINSNEDVGAAKYFRYEFEETYKIITPFISDYEIELTNVNTVPSTMSFDIIVSPRVEDKHICYKTEHQKEIIQTSTNNTQINRIFKFPIRFIDEENYIIREGYSILVKQYVQSFDSYNYYKILKKFGDVESLLLENQVGYVKSNISSIRDDNEKVIGFFDVSSFSKKRIFFNYYDLDLQKPDYPHWCITHTYDYRDSLPVPIDGDIHERERLLYYIYYHKPPWELLEMPQGDTIPIYTLLKPICSNCTFLASNVKPVFWED